MTDHERERIRHGLDSTKKIDTNLLHRATRSNPRNHCSRVKLHLRYKVIKLSSKLQMLTNSHLLSIKNRLVPKKKTKLKAVRTTLR